MPISLSLALSCCLARLRWAEGCWPPWAPAWIELGCNKGSLSSGGPDPPGNGGASLWVCMLGDTGDKGCTSCLEMPCRLQPGFGCGHLGWQRQWGDEGDLVGFVLALSWVFSRKGTTLSRGVCWCYTEEFVSFIMFPQSPPFSPHSPVFMPSPSWICVAV